MAYISKRITIEFNEETGKMRVDLDGFPGKECEAEVETLKKYLELVGVKEVQTVVERMKYDPAGLHTSVRSRFSRDS